jgi:ligand-binding SRPBCC domain-containing protein
MHTIRAVQKIPSNLTTVWELFSNPANLKVITPESLNFRVLTGKQGDAVFAGQIIDYRVSPLLGIPLFWRTEIIEVRDHEFFVDVQRKGPYSQWQHTHLFNEIPGGVEMTDMVQYKNPFGIMGRWANKLLVKRELHKIFEYRFRKVEEILGKWEGQAPLIDFS